MNEQIFINRELSWLEFNQRVLEEAEEKETPLLERLKFLGIVSSNFDEFFMVRVAALWDQVDAGFEKKDPAGLSPKKQLYYISEKAHKIVQRQYECYNEELLSELKNENLFFLSREDLTEKQTSFVQEYYKKNVFPVLTPMVVDQSRPFPLILNKSLNIALMLDKEDKSVFATVQVPSVLNRTIEIPSEDGRCFMLLEEIIKMNLETLFIGHNVLSMGCFRITRNADLSLDEEGAEDLLETIEQSLQRRKWGAVIRLEFEKGMDASLINILLEELEVFEEELYEIEGPLDLTYLLKLTSLENVEHLKYDPIQPHIPSAFKEEKDIFKVMAHKDILLHHPYASFDPVVELVKQAAKDPKVLAIKQTLYRVSGKSPLVEALAEAALNGKQVSVLVELKARFDEQNNIHWAKRLEKAGCHVIYGLVGLKTHCKLLLVVRKEETGIKRYVHLSTGNYNDVTAKIYTDLGLFTVNPHFGEDASLLFNTLSGYSELTKMHKLYVAPINLRNKFLKLIEHEIKNAKEGKQAKIIAKMNSLVDEQIIRALYNASKVGVKIDLIIRGICCLKPGIPGISDNISVRSIIGRFLEHSRIFYFYHGGDEKIFLSSADWMTRNLDRRVETLFPIDEEEIKKQIKEILDISLKDNVKARILKADGEYERVQVEGKTVVNSQEYFYKKHKKNSKKKKKITKEFKPITY